MAGGWLGASRRGVLGGGLAALAVGGAGQARVAAGGHRARSGTLAPDWQSLAAGYQVPAWFREARFGIWAHWGPQCQPERGDWYGRSMYIPGTPAYQHQVATYGHPTAHGFIDVIGDWHGEHWDPDFLVQRYKAAGARYFMAMACHHDNLDLFTSDHHGWNSTRVGPKRDVIAGWEKAARGAGLKFGVSNHASHAWHWWQTAYGYDAQGLHAGQRYDAWHLRREHGQGTWWQGLDPQALYTGPNMAPPDGITSDAAMDKWHQANDGQWLETVPPRNPAFAARWLARQKNLVERYRPDMVYFDDYGLPFDHYGLEAAAHFYNQATAWHGSPDVVLTAKRLSDDQQRAVVEDVERGFAADIRPRPWQTCTCIGDWHYNRDRFAQKSYVPAHQVIQRLVDVVSKNGNLLLSIPLRGDGTYDAEESKILDGITAWMAVHGDAMIHGSRPWRRYGEGPTKLDTGIMAEGKSGPFTAQDIRFTTKHGALFAAMLEWPDAPVRIASLGQQAGQVASARLLGGGPVPFRQDADGLVLTLPPRPEGGMVPVVQLDGAGLI
ncbi:alpha-L-fucosidase [Novosphingobium sp. 1529]|uniref:alpha-L-fucosidase n=1 Tax=Novosphingobium sp. 1529 TaxID=3156424 RepID=UPI001441F53B